MRDPAATMRELKEQSGKDIWLWGSVTLMHSLLAPASSTKSGCSSARRHAARERANDKALHDLVGELSTRSDTFRQLWGSHDVRTHGSGTKRFNHPVVGELTLAYEELAITADPGLVLTIYTAEPGSSSAERLRLLESWAATNVPAVSSD